MMSTLKSKLLNAAKSAKGDDPLAIPKFLNAKDPKRAAEIAANSKRPAVSVRAIDANKVAAPKAKPAKAKGKRREDPDWMPKVIAKAKGKGVTRRDLLELTGRKQVTPKMMIRALAKRLGAKFWQRDVEGTAHYGINA